MKRAYWLVGSLVIGLALFFFVLQTFPLLDLLRVVAGITAPQLAAYVLVSFLITCMLVLRWKVICDHHDIDVSFSKLLGYRYVGYGLSFVTPGPRVGGEPARAALLTQHGIDFKEAFATTLPDKTLELLNFGILFVICTAITLFMVPLPALYRWTFGIVMLVILVLVTYGIYELIRGNDPIMGLIRMLRLHKTKFLKKRKKALLEFENIITSFYRESRGAFWAAFGLSTAAWLTSLLEYYIVLSMLGIQANFTHVFLIYSLVGFVYLLPVPLALGVFEAVQTGIFRALGFLPAAGAALALITRARDMTRSIVGFILLDYYGVDALRMNNEPTKKSH